MDYGSILRKTHTDKRTDADKRFTHPNIVGVSNKQRQRRTVKVRSLTTVAHM